eukprot:5635873-Prymnesium_polylepis.1
MSSSVAKERVRCLSDTKSVEPAHSSGGGVVYWMSRDQRVQDNWALLHAQALAKKHEVGLSVVFCLVPSFLGATMRMYGFMLKGLKEVESELRSLGIPFRLLLGEAKEVLPAFVERHRACAVVADFSPLRPAISWKEALCAALSTTPVFEVDAHNIVPVWVASDKQEVGARTIRKKINDKLPRWL